MGEREHPTAAAGAETTRSHVPPVSCAPAAALDRSRPIPSHRKEGARYFVIDEIGRGGMGVVLRAYDPRLQREVALKTVRLQERSAATHEGILREAQTMAKLSHPNVVAVYDVVAVDGELVIAMEYVRGTSLGDWLETSAGVGRRSWQEILSAFIAAGYGLAAAHAARIVHRDFKPANVIVGHDGRVRVTDFGIALHREPGSKDRTESATVAGTPRFMAPEQHVGDHSNPAVDQYAFCVALFESLTGVRAFVGEGDELVAAKRRGPPRWPRDVGLPKHITKAIDRGLAPAPSDRWPTMTMLLQALSRGSQQRIAPFVAVAGGVALVGGSGLAWSFWDARQARLCTGAPAQIEEIWNEARRIEVERAMHRTGLPYAGRVWESVAVELENYTRSWIAGHRDACEATAVRREQPVELLDLRMACLHRAKVELEAVLNHFAAADSVERAQNVVAGLPSLQRCSDIDALNSGTPPPQEAVAAVVEAARERLAEVRVLVDAGKAEEAQDILAELVPQVESAGYAPLHTETLLLVGAAHQTLGHYAESRDANARAFVSALRTREHSAAVEAALRLIEIVGWYQVRTPEAQAYVPVARALLRENSVEEARLLRALGSLYENQGLMEDAERQYRAALALFTQLEGQQQRTLITRGILAGVLNVTHRSEEAVVEQRAVLDGHERLFGAEHPFTIGERSDLALMVKALGRLDEAEALLRSNLAFAREVVGPDHPQTGFALSNLASVLLSAERYADSREVAHAAIALWEKLGDRRLLATARLIRAETLRHEGRFAEAEAEYRQVLPLRIAMFGADNPQVAFPRYFLGLALHALGRHTEAHEQLAESLRVQLQFQPPDSVYLANLRSDLARLLVDLGRYDEAETKLRAAHATFLARFGSEDEQTLETRERLAALVAAHPRRDR